MGMDRRTVDTGRWALDAGRWTVRSSVGGDAPLLRGCGQGPISPFSGTSTAVLACDR